MPKWLQGMILPTVLLWLFAAVYGVASAMGADVELQSSIALPFIITFWVISDARKQGRPVCYDYDSFVFFGWPVVAPVYLFKTRGLRALLTLLCFIGVSLIAMLAAAVVFLVREFVLS